MSVLLVAATVGLLAFPAHGLQAEKPIGDPLVKLVCHGIDEVTVYKQAFPDVNKRVFESPSTRLFRFASGNLYISAPDRKEYFYNVVRKHDNANDDRYISAHYTLVFDIWSGYRKGTFVHTDSYATTVTNVLCTAP